MPQLLILLFFIHFTFGIRSMCKTIEEAETHMDLPLTFCLQTGESTLKECFLFCFIKQSS